LKAKCARKMCPWWYLSQSVYARMKVFYWRTGMVSAVITWDERHMQLIFERGSRRSENGGTSGGKGCTGKLGSRPGFQLRPTFLSKRGRNLNKTRDLASISSRTQMEINAHDTEQRGHIKRRRMGGMVNGIKEKNLTIVTNRTGQGAGAEPVIRVKQELAEGAYARHDRNG